MFKLFKLKVPTGDTVKVEAIETWMVSWEKTTGTLTYLNTKPGYQAFTNRKDAVRFKAALEDAHKLLGNNGRVVTVTIEKQESIM
ncbi:hypothetical protein [Paenibacillus odorifer]|uniref:hypothetical protein n=1 Tax=Paenibacillus odorifer TaxID=189426 RepID=UPI0009700F1D|nr:hypothetical protein [Paenibacillus odorifer]OMD76899.1 hypothetical protein BSK50_14200 [Paenibacillus odorifer]